jgi:Protein of unknown function (DUF551)
MTPSPATSEQQWQPIETAPKDGTVIWTLWNGVNNKTGEPSRYYNAAHFDNEGGDWWDTGGDYVIDEPTHWMPLPEPPK